MYNIVHIVVCVSVCTNVHIVVCFSEVQMYIFIKVYNTNCRSFNSVINIDKSLKIVFFLDIQDVMLNFCQTALNGLYLTFFGLKCPKNASLLNMCMFLWRANLKTLLRPTTLNTKS